MKFRKISFMLIFIVLFNIVQIMSVSAINVSGNFTAGISGTSGTCDTGICSATEIFSGNNASQRIADGVRVLLYINNTYKTEKDLWFNSTKRANAYGTIGYRTDSDNIGTIYGNYIAKVGVNNAYKADVFNYAGFLESLTQDEFSTILGKLGNYSISNCQNCFLVFEPIFVLKYKDWNYTYYFSGTVKEITTKLLSGTFTDNNHVKIFAKYFAYNDYADCLSKSGASDSYCQNWHVLKNYLTSFTLLKKQSPFTSDTSCSNSSHVYTMINDFEKNKCGKGIINVSDFIISCEDRLSALGNSPTESQLIGLWKDYYDQSPSIDHRGLLNFDDPSCGVEPTGFNNKLSCLSANYKSSKDNNWSGYTDVITEDGKLGFCRTEFNLSPSESYEVKNGIKSGQLYFNVVNGILVNGTFRRQCYFTESLDKSSISQGEISDYIKNVKFGNNNLILSVIDNNESVTLTTSDNKVYSYTKEINYLIPGIWANNISGEPSLKYCKNCKFLGYGILSKFNKSDEEKIQFSIEFIKDLNKENEDDDICTYKSIPEIIKKVDKKYKLNVEFRKVDVKNPFPGKEGDSRTPGFNWLATNPNKDEYENVIKNSNLDLDGNGVVDDEDAEYLLFHVYFPESYPISEEAKKILDTNGDGEITDQDAVGLNSKVNKPYDESIFLNRPNSYGIIPSTGVKTTPKYTIELTPDVVKQIREQNKNKNYDDYNMSCVDDGKICKSDYLTTLSDNGYLTITNSDKRKQYDDYVKSNYKNSV